LFSVQSLFRRRYPLAVLAGLLLAASLPKIGIAGLAWVAPALMLLAASGKGGGDCFRIGYVAGLAHYLGSLYWLLLIPVAWFPILGWLALSAYLALYPATWVWLVSASARNIRLAVANPAGAESAVFQAAGETLPWNWGQRMCWAFSGAVMWVALEMIAARLFSGFPWNLLGASQFQLLPLIQIASVTGIYGVSFLVVWTSLSLFSAGRVILARPTLRSAWVAEIILPLALLAIIFGFGFKRISQLPVPDRELNVALVQPSIPQTLIWDPKEATNRFRQVIELSERALAGKPDLLIWPEAAVPNLLRYDEPTYQAVTGLARSNRAWMIVGADDAEPRLDTPDANDADYFNSSFLVNPEGELVTTYRKRNLVIFGEYVPLARWLPFVQYLTPITGGFTPGGKPVPFELGDRRVKTATLICFEDVFPQHVREYVDADTDFLVNLTNDGWFGESAEQWQHAASAIFRAVENGLSLLRCCNNGLTCWVDSCGRLQQVFRDQKGSVHGAGVMHAKIPLLVPGEKRPPTFYNRHGDWFGWSCVAITIAIVLTSCRRRLLD
jgi:apolipoprotein N-acyltransferase